MAAPYIRPLSALPKDILLDQKRVFLSPTHIRKKDWLWLMPMAGATSFLLSTDERNMRERFRGGPVTQDRSALFANAGVGAMLSIPAYLSWYGWRHNDEYAGQTARLSARAVAVSVITTEVVKLITRRERPLENAGGGRFLQAQGANSSFPSMHSAMVWAVAPVVADRYPGWLTKVAVYGLASAVSASRVAGSQHFPSDVLIGSSLGWLVGHYVARSGGHDEQRRFLDPPSQKGSDHEPATSEFGFSYVPMDSWVYPALDRLAALGLIHSQIAGLRPWTRSECRRQLAEAEDSLLDRDNGWREAAAAESLLAALRREFNETDTGRGSVVLDSVYLRNGGIAGPVLNDGYHFGQTWTNDFGRPFGRGWNMDTGFSVRAEQGPFFAYLRNEYQHAPAAPATSLETRTLIAGLDTIPLPEEQARPATNRYRVVEGYAGVRLANLELSVGKQAMWWGPGADGPLSFSTNAEPTKNAKISMLHPYRLPGFLGHLGLVRGEFVIGKLGGHAYTWRPWFNAQKLSFKLTDNLEMGFTRWSIFWGVGHPITAGTFIRNFTATSSQVAAGATDPRDPGDRKAGFDFKYRIPGLRDWLTIYSDSYSDDDPSPLAAPRHAAISPGLHLTRIPGVPRLDLRIEVASTTPFAIDRGGQFVYFNGQYRSGNTNYGNLLGSSVGRDGRAIQAWSTYWLSARTKLEAGYRQRKISGVFLPGGGTQSDASLRGSMELPGHCYADMLLQYERFWIPVLGGPQRNISGRLELRWEPRLRLFR
ncbi:capsule assembly Wzi family protein [uncultured Paludibaculum sp.]|uniref:capsule assembly Wzi family protein n=1 Tax=uncultured Paludibaculum sp. TaxID=1765020 RepID=UPI002AAB7110|nr:capsule assembly Wzi family protein [uncultured Paludibaculum sp.]